MKVVDVGWLAPDVVMLHLAYTTQYRMAGV